MTSENISAFNLEIQAVAELYGKDISDERVLMYWEALKDLEWEEFKVNVSRHIKINKFFPLPSELRDSDDPEAIANQDFDIIVDLMNKFSFDGFQQCGSAIIELKLKEMNRIDLYDPYQRWGSRILNDNNPSALRAQFIRARSAEIKRDNLQLPSGPERKQIQDKVDGLLEGIGKSID